MRDIRSSSKYKNKKVWIDGMCFDSKAEADRYKELKALQDRGEIQHLQRQVEYELIPAQRSEGKAIRKCSYIADFVYTYKGDVVVEDVKSKYTAKLPEYRIKKKLLMWRYGVIIREIIR